TCQRSSLRRCSICSIGRIPLRKLRRHCWAIDNRRGRALCRPVARRRSIRGGLWVYVGGSAQGTDVRRLGWSIGAHGSAQGTTSTDDLKTYGRVLQPFWYLYFTLSRTGASPVPTEERAYGCAK